MNVAVIGGTGYVGLVTGIGLAVHGNNVICADIDEKKIINLNNNVLPIYEDGLPSLLEEAKMKNKIRFTTCIKDAVTESEIIMIAVGTPESKNGGTDLSHLINAWRSIAACMNGYKVIVIKSTVPVGTCEIARAFLHNNMKNAHYTFDVVSNPEFLREGSAVRDFLFPERIVLGADSEKSSAKMKELYSTFDTPVVLTDTKSSEMLKYACNSYLAARISFINEIAEICEKVGADINSVLQGMKLDKRIGSSYLSPGPGFGGPCLNKDIKSLINFGAKANANVSLLKSVLNRNEVQIKNIMSYISKELADTSDKNVTILGLSFKAGTNDTRNSPSVKLLQKLSATKNNITVYDPVVKKLEETFGFNVHFAQSLEDAVSQSDCLIIMTEWEEFKAMDLCSVYNKMRTPVIIDAKNLLPFGEAVETGFKYKGIGIGDSRAESYMKISGDMV